MCSRLVIIRSKYGKIRTPDLELVICNFSHLREEMRENSTVCSNENVKFANIDSFLAAVYNNNTVYLDDDAAFIIAQSHAVGARLATYTPHPLHAVVECVF